jgi:hypothetical protein
LKVWEIAGEKGEVRPAREGRRFTHEDRDKLVAAFAARREPHVQQLNEEYDQDEFEHCQFVARYLDHQATAKGDYTIRLRVHRTFRHEVEKFVGSLGIPVSVDVERWRNYDNLRGISTEASSG